ncbi:sensor histidine kinase [Streptacidiphilus monticola]|uniref:histidine kinase n=1 Tax=Streptacidiphilus monticola TaxID=2161674 RepID=A0ABW1G1R4_9ACTN
MEATGTGAAQWRAGDTGRLELRIRRTVAGCLGIALPFGSALYEVTVTGPPSRHTDGLALPLFLLAALVGCAALACARRQLTSFCLLLVAAWATAAGSGSALALFVVYLGAGLCLGLMAVTRSRRASLGAAWAASASLLWYVLFQMFVRRSPVEVAAVVAVGLAAWLAWVLGRSARQRAEYRQALRAQGEVHAVTAERLRIARELHDMVAHSVGIVAIQAGMGARVFDEQPEEARRALQAIEATSREALAGLRRTVAGLRRSAAEAAASDPSPTLADLDRFAAATAGAGVAVAVERCGRPRLLGADVELAAYRIVQESVTNVVRHSGADRCTVRLDYGADALVIAVTDRGRGGAPRIGGFGVAGMRERAELLGGALDAGPRPEGGFAVTARLPLGEAS